MIHLPKTKGLCIGVTKTLNTIYEVYEREIKKDNPQNIYVYQNFINDEIVIKELNDLGIKIINNLKNLTSNDIVIITYRGISKDDLKYLKNNKINYIDTTCRTLDKIYNHILKYQNKGYLTIMIGKDNLDIPNLIIVNQEEDLNKINKDNKVYVTKSITCDNLLFDKIINIIKNEFKEVIIDKINCPSYDELSNSREDIINNYPNTFNIENNDKFKNLKEFCEFILNSDYTYQMEYGIISNMQIPTKEMYNYKYLLTFLLFYKDTLKELIKNQEIINNSLTNENDNQIIKNLINDFQDLNQDGKYIRGTLIALGEYISTHQKKDYLNLATAYETFETSILIHDDIIDNAKIRRGKMTIPRRICNTFLGKNKEKSYFDSTLKLANSIGICLGDYGLFTANQIIYNNYQNHPSFNKILELYNDIVIKTIKGEILDVYLPFVSKYGYQKVNEEDILNIYHLKTSLYTIIGPFNLGYALSGLELNKDIEDILDEIGIYFQIKDDLLDIFSSSNITGKSNLSDIKEFKQTLLYSYIVNTDYKDEFLKIYGRKNATNKDLNRIRELLEESHSKQYTLDYLTNIYYDCLEKIDKLNILEENKDLLKGLLIYLSLREK